MVYNMVDGCMVLLTVPLARLESSTRWDKFCLSFYSRRIHCGISRPGVFASTTPECFFIYVSVFHSFESPVVCLTSGSSSKGEFDHDPVHATNIVTKS